MSTRGFGGLRDVGSNGYSWSSTITGSDAHFLYFHCNGVNPQSSNARAYGFPLRCLQEEGEDVPAPGYRHRDYGTLYDVGGAGYIWSSTIPAGSGSAHYLYFGYGEVSPQSSNGRAYGFPLRCLQE